MLNFRFRGYQANIAVSEINFCVIYSLLRLTTKLFHNEEISYSAELHQALGSKVLSVERYTTLTGNVIYT